MNTTIHNLENLDPAAYEYFDSYSNKQPEPQIGIPVEVILLWIKEWREHREAIRPLFSKNRYPSMGRCDCCGAHLTYVQVYKHKNGDHVKLGETCASRVELNDSRAELAITRLKEAAKNERESAKRTAGRRIHRRDLINLLRSDPELRLAFRYRKDNGFIHDVFSKFIDYGVFSPAQEAALRKSGVSAKKFAKAKIEQQAKLASSDPVAEGRYEITGKVISEKWVDGYYGETHKMVVELDDGNRVYGSVPSTIDSVERGDLVAFAAAVERSDKDEHFGFYKRPTKARLLTEVAL